MPSNHAAAAAPDATRDLVIERTVDAPRELVWDAWTRPEMLKQWFTPAPWKTVDAEIDLRPGGIFRTLMQSPEGQEFPNVGTYLEVVKHERLVWTDALLPGWRPAPKAETLGFHFTCVITLEAVGKLTRYRGHAMHGSAQDRDKHEKMGFHEGWGAAWDQLVALIKKGK
jgi:uncharacterized protein YndB with AHSA1/START domain